MFGLHLAERISMSWATWLNALIFSDHYGTGIRTWSCANIGTSTTNGSPLNFLETVRSVQYGVLEY